MIRSVPLVLLVLVPAVGSQETVALSAEQEHLLRIRGREALHPSEPLDLRGSEEGDNGFRSRTPALAKSTAAAARIDFDELYARRRAMIEEGARFQTAPDSTRQRRSRDVTHARRSPEPKVAETQRRGIWWGTAVIGAFLLAGALGWRRLTPTPRVTDGT